MKINDQCKGFIIIILVAILLFVNQLIAQEIREYEVKRTVSALNIDGQLIEEDWQAAALTERFIIYYDGSETVLATMSKFLWDDNYLYIGFVCEDPDVWATLENRDDHLWNGEVVEILCDPNGDGLDYFEVQVNPLETILDLLMTKAYYLGGSADLTWDLDSIKAGVWVDGTLNDYENSDSLWTCEVALPFAELAFMAPNQNIPPQDGDEWRMLTTRYDYPRDGNQVLDPEVSSWNQTQSQGGFHVPTKFGRIIFSEELVVSINSENQNIKPVNFSTIENYPNPFNPSTTIEYHISKSSHVNITIFDILGGHVQTLVDKNIIAGTHLVKWDGRDNSQNSMSSGIYLLKLQTGDFVKVRKLILTR